jgi:hypothetical protein
LHDEPKDCEANGVAQCAQLFGVSIQFGRHGILLTNSKEPASSIARILETGS